MNVRHILFTTLGLAAVIASPVLAEERLALRVPVTSPCLEHISAALGTGAGRVIALDPQSILKANARTYILPYRVAATEPGLPKRIPKLPSLRNTSYQQLIRANVNSAFNGSWLVVKPHVHKGRDTGDYEVQTFIDVTTATGSDVTEFPERHACETPSMKIRLPARSLPADIFKVSTPPQRIMAEAL